MKTKKPQKKTGTKIMYRFKYNTDRNGRRKNIYPKMETHTEELSQ